MTLNPAVSARLAPVSNAVTMASISASSSGLGTGDVSANGIALGPTTGQPPSSGVKRPSPPFHGQLATRFAAGVRQLDARDSTLGVDKPGDAGQRLDVVVFPNSKVARSNAPVCGNRSRLDHYEGDPADSPAAEVDQMPVIGKSIMGGILAHRRHGDPVPKCDTANFQGAEQIDFGHLPVVLSAGLAGAGGYAHRLVFQSFG